MKTAEFGKPAARVPQPGTCRICGSTDPDPSPGASINWADHTRTLCALPECIAEARRELGFVDGCDGGHGRTSIKQSHRAEGRNFLD